MLFKHTISVVYLFYHKEAQRGSRTVFLSFEDFPDPFGEKSYSVG